MNNAIVKNVLLSMFLVILCFVVGVQAAESAKVSIGILVALVGIAFMLWMGPRVWTLIYLVPPIMTLLPLPGKLGTLPMEFLVSGLVLFYWIVMWIMGYVKFKWRSLLVLDLLVLVVFCYMVASYLRHPVSMAILGYDAEYIGGKEYVWCIVATVHYLAISTIPCTYEQVKHVMNWGVRLSVAACMLSITLSLLGIRGGTDITELADAATNTRFGMFVTLGIYGIYYFYGTNPLIRIICSPALLLACMFSLIGIVLSGAREVLMDNCFKIMFIAIIKRELWCLMVMGLLCYGGLLYLSSEGVVEKFPLGVQRCFSMLPGVRIDKEIEAGTTHSSEWRIEMWKWALDERTGYVQDYVWGDGFGQSVDYLRRETTSMMRGTTVYGDLDYFAQTGTWHSGVITAIHRLGYVGLAIISMVSVVGLILLCRTGMAWKGTPLFLPFLFFTVSFSGSVPVYFISAGTIPFFFKMYLALSFIKLLYCLAREQGRLTPLLQRQRYVPQVIREHGDQLTA